MSPAALETAIPACEWPQSYALDGAVTGILRYITLTVLSKDEIFVVVLYRVSQRSIYEKYKLSRL
jgi:hypothetical protein